MQKFGIQRVIWLEGEPSEPVTSGHVDGYVLFNAPGSVLVEGFDDEKIDPSVTRFRDIAALEQAKDAAERTFSVQQILAPRKRYWRFGGMYAPCYLNAYVANGAVITMCFGDAERDEAAKYTLSEAFPTRKIVMLKIDHIVAGGGGVRCLTQPMFTPQRA